MHEGAISSRLGLRGWPRVAEDIIVARDVLLAEYTRARYHVAHVSTLGRGRASFARPRARGLSVTAEVTPHHLLLTARLAPRLRHRVQGQPAAPRATRTWPRCAPRSPTGRSTASRPTTRLTAAREGLRVRRGRPGDDRPRALRAAPPVARARRNAVARALRRGAHHAPARVVGLPPPRIAEGARADLTLVDPDAPLDIDPSRLRTQEQEHAVHGAQGQGARPR